MNENVLAQGKALADTAVERFSAMLLGPATRQSSPVHRACAVSIEAGRHQGAVARLRTSPVRIGSAIDNDVVLLDDGVAAHHAELRRVDGRWALYAGASAQALPIVATTRQAACLRTRYRLGSAELLISQCVRDAAPDPGGQQHWRRITTAMLFVLAATISAALIVQFAQPAEARLPSGTRSLSGEGWPDVRIVVDASRQTSVEGHVDDDAAKTRLQAWLRARGMGNATWRVRVGSALAQQVRDLLGQPHLSVSYLAGGVVRVQGTSNDPGLRERLQRLRADMLDVASVEDDVVYLDPTPEPKFRPLPFRIVSVMPGEHGSFTTDTGGRFFVGAVLPDGAEVMAILPDGVEFRLGETSVVYPLK